MFSLGIVFSGFSSSLAMLILCYSLISGLGLGMVYGCTINNTIKFFPDKRGLIGGILTAVYGLSSVVIPPIANAMINSLGVLPTFRILGLVFLVVICGATAMVHQPPHDYRPPNWSPSQAQAASRGQDKDWREMLKDPIFYIMISLLMCGAFYGLMIISQASPIAQNLIGVSPATAAICVSVLALFNMAGLASLGYKYESIDGMSHWGPFDSSSNADGIKYEREWDNGFGLIAFYEMLGSSTGTEEAKYDSDADKDRYTIEARYKWDGGGMTLAAEYARNYTNPASNGSGLTNIDGLVYKNGDISTWALNPSFMHTWGNFSLHFEGKFSWGRLNRLLEDANGQVVGIRNKAKARGMGLYLDGQYNYGSGHVALAGWLVDGNKYDSGDGRHTDRSMVEMGNDFYVLEVAYRGNNVVGGRWNNGAHMYSGGNAFGLANNTDLLLYGRDAFAVGGGAPDDTLGLAAGALNKQGYYSLGNGMANNWVAALRWAHTFTPEIKMHCALAYMSLLHPNYKVATAYNTTDNLWSDYRTQSKDVGVEMDLAFNFNLLDNLYLTSSFAYMFNGDAYKSLKHYTEVGLDEYRAVWTDPDDTYSWINTLTFYF